MNKTIIMIILLLSTACSGLAENITGDLVLFKNDDSIKVKLSVESNFQNAKVYLDTTFIGLTPLKNYEVIPGSYMLKIINPKLAVNWESENKFFEADISKDTTINVNFKYFYFFNTTPFGVSVFQNDSLLGNTPLRFFRDDELTGNLIFKKNNYKDYYFDLGNYDFETGANIVMQSKGTETVNDAVYKNRGTQFKTKRSLLTIAGLAVASVTGAVFSIKFKNEANDSYNKYLLSGDTSELDNSRANDKYFIVSLVLMQAALGGLIYFLFFD